MSSRYLSAAIATVLVFTGTACGTSGTSAPTANVSATTSPPSATRQEMPSASSSRRVGPYRVTYVYDGDTAVVTRGNERLTVRVVGINTPEVDGPYRDAQCFGTQASVRGKQLLLDRHVWLERDPNQATQDKYGRNLAFIWIDNKVDFGLTMISEGYAYEYTYDLAYPYQQEYRSAEAIARSEGRGLWSAATCGGQH